MGKRKFLVRVPRNMHDQVKNVIAFIAENTEHPKDRLVCRQILRKFPDKASEHSIVDYRQMELGPQEARTFNDIIEVSELPSRLKAQEMR